MTTTLQCPFCEGGSFISKEHLKNHVLRHCNAFAMTLIPKRIPQVLPEDYHDMHLSQGCELIMTERNYQMLEKHFSVGYDSRHAEKQLAKAALSYLVCYIWDSAQGIARDHWPWVASTWNPQDDLNNLVRVGALIAAEIDRLVYAGMGDKG